MPRPVKRERAAGEGTARGPAQLACRGEGITCTPPSRAERCARAQERQRVAGRCGKNLPLERATSRKNRGVARMCVLGTVVVRGVRGRGLRGEMAMDPILGVHESALLFRAKRMDVLAANLANSDTPQYKARDVEFSTVLDRAQGAASRLTVTNERHIAPDALASRESLLYRIPHQPSLDGNTVEADLEAARYAENAVSYQASLLFATGRIASLRTALSGTR
jgi:flagellar basal-body rod protein FlgB